MILNLNDYRRPESIDETSEYHYFNMMKKPIEIYFFHDPLCSKCWDFDTYLKKLSIEYGRFFTIRSVIVNHLMVLNVQNSPFGSMHAFGNQTSYPQQTEASYLSIIQAIKAAELQGKNAGRNFLRRIQEHYFVLKNNIQDLSILIRCAKDSNLDVEEFLRDLNSESAKRASQCDLRVTKEMEVDQTPTVVFFNHLGEEDGIKVTGINPYDIYVMILNDLLNTKLIPSRKPPIIEYLSFYGTVSEKELCIVFDLSKDEVEYRLKKLQLTQQVERRKIENTVIWKYVK